MIIEHWIYMFQFAKYIFIRNGDILQNNLIELKHTLYLYKAGDSCSMSLKLTGKTK